MTSALLPERICLDSDQLSLTLALTPGVSIEALTAANGAPLLLPSAAGEVFALNFRIAGRIIQGSQFHLVGCQQQPGEVILQLSGSELPIEVELTLRVTPTQGLQVLLNCSIAHDNMGVALQLPFLSELAVDGVGFANSEPHCMLLPGTIDGPYGLLKTGEFFLPLSIWNRQQGVAFVVRQAPVGWRRLSSVRSLEERWLSLDYLGEKSVTVDGRLFTHPGGWLGTFRGMRREVRNDYDLSEYQRPDFAWYRDIVTQHFTFAYSKEIYDYDRDTFDIDHFLAEGKRRFGGYDAMLFWCGYPRLGVDQRSQWDFYDDLPQGRDGLRRLGEAAQAAGVRFFLPYLPWDQAGKLAQQVTADDGELLAELVQDTNADGLFLDTMHSVDDGFRQKIDAIKPGVVFCSEGRPQATYLQRITGAWDQTWGWEDHREGHMPEVDLLRFLFPEHKAFMINRHALGQERMDMLWRALFNGEGMVIWQDVFGDMRAYTDEEAELTRNISRVLRTYKHIFFWGDAIPLWDTGSSTTLCNCFRYDQDVLFTFYNSSCVDVTSVTIRSYPWPPTCQQGTEAFADEGVPISVQDGDLRVQVMIPPRQVRVVVLTA